MHSIAESQKKRLLIVRTRYSHWGEHTAFNSLAPHLRNEGWQVKERRVDMDRGRFPCRTLERSFARYTRSRGIPAFRIRDLNANLRSLMAAAWGMLDVIHLLDGEHSLMGLPRWLRRLPQGRRPGLMVTLHQPPVLLSRLLRPEHLKDLDTVLTVSPEQENFLKQWAPSVRVRTILLGVDTGYFAPSKQLSPERPFVCLTGGIWMRDYGSFLATAQRLGTMKEIEFHVVSPPAEFVPRSDNIVIHRNIPDTELLRLYRRANLLFLPLLDATANTFLMEGAACGAPVISSDRPSIRAYFPGASAKLIPGNDPELFASAILELYWNPGQRRIMSQEARKRAESLSWERIAHRYSEVYLDAGRNDCRGGSK